MTNRNITFDPALLEDPSIPASCESFRVDALREHLRRYSGQHSPRKILARLEDPAWLAAWDQALSATTGSRVIFEGSELGVFALRALQHGAAHALCIETFPLDARIAIGMAQKHLLPAWRALHGAAIQEWPQDEQRRSFEAFAKDIDVVAPDDAQALDAQCDCFVFPDIDHSLLGTGVVNAVRRRLAHGEARVLPARAAVFAMAVQWNYPGTSFALQPMNRLRWSLYPQALELGPEFWTPLTTPVQVGEIDLAKFSATTWDIDLPVASDGQVDAIIFWFELDLGAVRISSAPSGELRCIKPAVQYTDPMAVKRGRPFQVRAHVEENRLYFQTRPAASQSRSHGLPSWYIPMLGDGARNEAYRAAIDKALAAAPATVLDIGAGCGLLSMMAAVSGAEHVFGCEAHPAVHAAGEEIVKLNGFERKITLLNKDCRALQVPEDLPRRPDLAVFELFDCSLIGEGILHFLAYARERLLAQNARYLPAGAVVRAMVIEHRLDRIWNIDANLLNPYRFTPSFINVDARALSYRPLTEPIDLFRFDFSTASPTPDARELLVPATASGVAGAVLFWFDLQLDETTWISNDPAAATSLHWKQGLQFMPEVRVDLASTLPLLAQHDGSGLRFQWRNEALPKDALSALPRFDPRWLAATRELEQRTRSLLQHCAQNPQEHAKTAQIAQRFAIKPAAHGLDPLIAQRFAAMFMAN